MRTGVERARLADVADGYSWASILLHWTAAAAVAALWVIGSSTQGAAGSDAGAIIRLHTTIAVCAYPFLWIRILWRVKARHPQPAPNHNRVFASIGAAVHYVMLAAVAGMLLSGPLMVWSGGGEIHVAVGAIRSPFPPFPALHEAMRSLHGALATTIAACVGLHVLGVLKHVAIDRDRTLDRMIIAGRQRAGTSR
jgi:cytochrome b561